MIKGLQIIGMLVGALLLSYTLYNYYKNKYSFKRTFFFSTFLIVMLVLFFNPSLLTIILPYLSTESYVISIIVISIIFIYVSLFYIYNQMQKIEKSISIIVQNMALRDSDIGKKNEE
jgi:hypothetical protein